eukprot:jgi/Undpi1/9289/HiC_scaffold_26.g11747.m1
MANQLHQNMNAVLSKHYLGEFKMRLGNITCTEMVRPLSKSGLQHLEQSIQDVGWLENFAPSVVIQQDRLGDSGKLTAETALTTPAHTLDGNHRIATLKKLFGDSGVFLVRVYLEFNQADERLIANALNDATESVVKRTLYDKVYFQHELEEAIRREMKKEKVTQADIRRMYQRVGVTPPSKTTLRNWQQAVDALHQESFEALKEVCESDEAEVDGPAVTLTYLTRKEFAEFSALQQRFCIHLVSRQAGGFRGVVVGTESPAVPTPFSPSTFKYLYKRPPVAKDYEDIDKNAGIAASFVESVLAVVPEDDWTPELRREVNRLSHEKPNQLALYVKPHQGKQADEAKDLLATVSAGDEASSNVVQLKKSISTVVTSMPLPRIRNILSKDATLREHLVSWDAKYQDVINQVNLHKVHLGTGGGDGSGGGQSNGSEGDGGGGDGDMDNGVDGGYEGGGGGWSGGGGGGGWSGGGGNENGGDGNEDGGGGNEDGGGGNEDGRGGNEDGGGGNEDGGGGNEDGGSGGGSGGGNDNEGAGGGGGGQGGEGAPRKGWNKGICCPTCKPPPTAR